MRTPRSEGGPRKVAGAVVGLLVAASAVLASGARAAAPPGPSPDVATAASTIKCPKLPPQPTEAELAAARACAGLTNSATPPATTGSGGAGAGGSGGSGGAGSASPGGPGALGNPPSQPSLNDVMHGPYVVKQTATLGHESISGSACDEARPFVVHFATPPAVFDTGFAPSTANGQSGQWSYAYNIPRAGESHSAHGTYTLQADAAAHALHLKMTGSDHVTFKGFDGNFPVHYQFDLVATPGAPCFTPH
jgi:hypothetical protein